MSLKAFHLFFIVLAILLAAGCAAWGFVNGLAPAFGFTCSGIAFVLVIYGVSFLKKSRKLIL
ncbi:MAG: hypothetical protein K8R23_03640 [Chthoniobacter sp.]|nr:hypothetical protein [Chthoniobacter sp.]